MTKKTLCNKCGKTLEEGVLLALVTFEGTMMYRSDEHYCIKCWESSELEQYKESE